MNTYKGHPSINISRPEWLLKDESNRPVCNFIPCVVKVIKIQNTPNRAEFISLKLYFGADYLDIELPSTDLDHICWSDIDSRCIVNSDYRKGRKYIANVIRAGMINAPIEVKTSINRLGIHHIGEKTFFAAGDRVLSRSPVKEPISGLLLEKLPFRLDIDESITLSEAFKGMRELIALCPEIGRVLIAHSISGLTRAAFKESGFIPCTVLVIVGKSGTLKSHYVPHMVQLYNRNEYIGPDTRFNSSERFIEDILYEYSECTAVIDDLHTGESKSIMRKNRNTAEEIIRRISDDTGRGRKSGNTSIQHRFNGNAIFIGEYSFGKDSTVPRALMVNLTRAPDGGVLDVYQRERPLLVSTFYYYFIQWYVDNFDAIRNMIDKKLTTFRKNNAKSVVHGRLLDTQFYLQVSYLIFLEFCVDSGFCSEQDAPEELLSFSEQLAELIRLHQARFNLSADFPEEVDYLKLIRKLYKNEKFNLAVDAKQFNSGDYDGLVYYDCLCLRGKRIDNAISKIVPGTKREDWVAFMVKNKVLKTVGNKLSVQISGCSGLRFYAIRLEKLK